MICVLLGVSFYFVICFMLFRISSQQYLSGDLFSYTNGAYEFCVEFCVVKFSSFG